MTIHLVNPSHVSFGIGVITPRWLYVLAAATPESYGAPNIVDETLEQIDLSTIKSGDIVGIGIHTGNALRGYELGTAAHQAGATVIYGGIHATLYPDEARNLGGGDAVVTGDGDHVWAEVLRDAANGMLRPNYAGGHVEGTDFIPARWSLLPEGRVMGIGRRCAAVPSTVRSARWRTDGQRPRQRGWAVVQEIVELRRRGFRFIALADDNFYPVTLEDLRMADRREDKSQLHRLQEIRAERFALMAQLARLPSDTVFFTQITMEAAEDPEFLDAMKRAHIKGALVGVESVTEAGLKSIYKNFNESGESLVKRLRAFREHDVHVLGSFIFGLPGDLPDSFDATLKVAEDAGLTFAQFVMLTPFPGTLDFAAWEKSLGENPERIGGIPISRHWLIPQAQRPKVYTAHPVMTADQIRKSTQEVWDRFYSFPSIWRRATASCVSLKSRLAFVLISKIYRQMYANTGIATDSARVSRSAQWARLMARPCRRLFAGRPMPELQLH
jgi:radical SAM superfamily enzyme YgiQ (UPF0313 family)